MRSKLIFPLIFLSFNLTACGLMWDTIGQNLNQAGPRAPFFLYMLGGCRANCTSNSTAALSSVDGINWVTIGNLPFAPSSGSAAVFNSLFYYLGGLNLASVTQSWTAASSNSAVTWATQANLPSARDSATCLVYSNRLWLIGGSNTDDAGVPLSDVITSSDGTSWVTATAALPNPISYAAGAVYNNLMWTIGGVTGANFTTFTSDVRTSADGVTWTLTGSFPIALGGAQATVFKGYLWVIGGSSVAGYAPGAFNTTVYYTSNGSSWNAAGSIPAGVLDPGVVVYQNKLWVISGEANYNNAAATEVYNSSDGTTWNSIGPLSFTPSFVHGGFMAY